MIYINVGDIIFLDDGDGWEVVAIKQPYDEHGFMMEPVLSLRFHSQPGTPMRSIYRGPEPAPTREISMSEWARHRST